MVAMSGLQTIRLVYHWGEGMVAMVTMSRIEPNHQTCVYHWGGGMVAMVTMSWTEPNHQTCVYHWGRWDGSHVQGEPLDLCISLGRWDGSHVQTQNHQTRVYYWGGGKVTIFTAQTIRLLYISGEVGWQPCLGLNHQIH